MRMRGRSKAAEGKRGGATQNTRTDTTPPSRGRATGTRRGGRAAGRRGGCTARGATNQSTCEMEASSQRGTRGRATRGTRGRRASRARACPNAPPRIYQPTASYMARFRDLQKRRSEEFMGLVKLLSADEKDELITKWIIRDPTVAFDIYDAVKANYPPEPPPNDSNPLPWCRCLNCQQMPTEIENVCCGLRPEHCMSRQAVFEIMIVEPGVLGLAEVGFGDFMAGEPLHDNRARRHGAYRQFIYWVYRRLGAGNRRVIPSCVVLRIRGVYPSPDGTYTGFRPATMI